MIQITDFYEDISFIAAIFYSNILSNASMYIIASHLNGKTSDDFLAKIVANGPDDTNNKKLFRSYLNKLKIKFSNPKRALVAKVFYYILHNRIDFNKGIKFACYNVSEYKNNTVHIGNDVGIEQIASNYFVIDDSELTDEKYIKTIKKTILEEMQQYVKDNLVEFPVGNTKTG